MNSVGTPRPNDTSETEDKSPSRNSNVKAADYGIEAVQILLTVLLTDRFDQGRNVF